MAEAAKAYPVNLSIDYPDRNLDRLSTFFRLFAIIPIYIILALLSGFSWHGGTNWHYIRPDTWQVVSYNIAAAPNNTRTTFSIAGVVLFLPTLLMILFRQKYPRWWFDWNLAFTKFSTRVGTYLALLRDEYPSTDEEQAVHFDMPYPDVKKDLNRWLPLFKWFFAIPHYIVLGFLGIAAAFCVFVSWFAIMFTGRYPRALFNFVVGFGRWGLRVAGYAFLLVTDRYPPFRLNDPVPPAMPEPPTLTANVPQA